MREHTNRAGGEMLFGGTANGTERKRQTNNNNNDKEKQQAAQLKHWRKNNRLPKRFTLILWALLFSVVLFR